MLVGEVSFELKAGEALGLIGPSGGGKTSLAKGLVGVWPLLRGKVRLDDADLDQWRADVLGEYIGYLPQDVSLLDGSIAENISRFEAEPDARKIVAAAKAAGVYEMIARLLDDPFPGPRHPIRPNMAVLVPIAHGFAAIATFVLAVTAAST